MSYIILPSRRLRQPQGAVRVNAKWLSRGMVGAYCPSAGTRDLARNNHGSIVGNITYDAGAQGRAWKGGYQASNNYIHVDRYPDFAYVSGVTFEALVEVFAWQQTNFPYISGVITQYENQPGTGYPAYAPLLRFNDNASSGHANIPTINVFQGGTEYKATGAAQSLNTPIHLIGLYNGANVVLWVNGVKTIGDALTGNMSNDVESYISLMSDYTRQVDALSHNRCLNGRMFFANIYNRGLTDAEAIERFANPWDHFAPDPRRIFFGAGAGTSEITGTSAVTLASDTGTANGTLTIAATSAATVSAVTGTTDADALIAATSSATLGATTGTADADVIVVATSAQTLDAVTGTANGTVLSGAAGTSDVTVAATTGTAVGVLPLTATSAATVGIVTGTAAGVVALIGTSAQTVNDVTGAAAGTSTGAAAGTSTATVGATTGTAAGYVDVLGSAAASVGAVTGTASGAVEAGPATGASSATLAALTGTAAAQIIVAGTSAGQLGGVTGPAPTQITSVDPRYLANARGRRFTAKARGRVFTAKT